MEIINLEKYNPFGTFRKYQEEVIREIIEECYNERKNIILKAPVAAGKSLIAYTVANYIYHMFEDGFNDSLIFTSTKFLQDQYLNDFADLRTVKGRNNFRCVVNESKADKGHCKQRCNFICPYSIDKNLELKKDPESSCPYWVQKIEAMNNPISIMNYTFGLIDHSFVRHFLQRKLAIFDEAHNIEAELMNFLETKVNPKEIYRDVKYNIKDTSNIADWIDSLTEVADRYKYLADEKEIIGEKEESDKFLSKSEKYKMTVKFLIDNPDNWVVDRDDGVFIFKPIMVSDYAHSLLLSFGQTRLFMSGSILRNHSFSESLGLDMDDTHIIEIPSIISPERRPVIREYAGSMSMRNRNMNIGKIVSKILEIADRHKEEKGLIHTYTYIISNMLKEKLGNNDRFIFHDSYNRESKTREFVDSDDPKIFVSPYSFEGVDFKNDQARFQIIAKNPFPNTFNNNQLQVRDKVSDFHWIFEERCKVLSQMYGRIVRSPDDWGVTYLVDSDIESLLGPSSLVTGYFFEGFVDDWINKCLVIVDENRLSPDKRKSYESERQNERIVLEEIKKMSNPTVVGLVELYKRLPNDAFKEVRPICERLLKNGSVILKN